MKTTRLVLAGLVLCFSMTGLLAAQNTAPVKTGLPGVPVRSTTTTSSAAPAPSAPAGSAPASSVPPPGGAPGPSAATATVGGVKNVMLGEPIHAGYVIAMGTKSGQLGNGIIEAVKFQFHPDTSSGASLGQLTFTKKWDAASLPLLTVLSSHETLATVTIDFMAIDRMGREVKAMSMKLTNVTVTSVNQYLDSTGALEDVTLNFSQVEMADPISKSSYSWRR